MTRLEVPRAVKRLVLSHGPHVRPRCGQQLPAKKPGTRLPHKGIGRQPSPDVGARITLHAPLDRRLQRRVTDLESDLAAARTSARNLEAQLTAASVQRSELGRRAEELEAAAGRDREAAREARSKAEVAEAALAAAEARAGQAEAAAEAERRELARFKGEAEAALAAAEEARGKAVRVEQQMLEMQVGGWCWCRGHAGWAGGAVCPRPHALAAAQPVQPCSVDRPLCGLSLMSSCPNHLICHDLALQAKRQCPAVPGYSCACATSLLLLPPRTLPTPQSRHADMLRHDEGLEEQLRAARFEAERLRARMGEVAREAADTEARSQALQQHAWQLQVRRECVSSGWRQMACGVHVRCGRSVAGSPWGRLGVGRWFAWAGGKHPAS